MNGSTTNGPGMVWKATSSAASWSFAVGYDFLKFGMRAAKIAVQSVSQMVSDPVSLTNLLAGAALAFAVMGCPAGLLLWAKATALAIAATSMAQAAGVTDPVVLSLLAAAAGTLGAGPAKVVEFVRSGAAWAVNQVLQRVEGAAAPYLAFFNSLASSLIVNAAFGKQRSGRFARDSDVSEIPECKDPVVDDPVSQTAVHQLRILNPISIETGREIAGTILLREDGTLTITEPEFGSSTSSAFDLRSDIVGTFHTHGSYSWAESFVGWKGSENFSSLDISAIQSTGVRGYLGTPLGAIRMYDPVANCQATIAVPRP